MLHLDKKIIHVSIQNDYCRRSKCAKKWGYLDPKTFNISNMKIGMIDYLSIQLINIASLSFQRFDYASASSGASSSALIVFSFSAISYLPTT